MSVFQIFIPFFSFLFYFPKGVPASVMEAGMFFYEFRLFIIIWIYMHYNKSTSTIDMALFTLPKKERL